jgi:hypothetical protein
MAYVYGHDVSQCLLHICARVVWVYVCLWMRRRSDRTLEAKSRPPRVKDVYLPHYINVCLVVAWHESFLLEEMSHVTSKGEACDTLEGRG